MLLVFIDETGDAKFKKYFGLSIAVVKHNFYRQIKEEFQNILLEHGWDPKIEFKGSCLFSATSGDTNVAIDERIAIATEVLRLTASEANTRMRFFYVKHETDNVKKDYLNILPLVLKKALPTATDKRQGKDIISVACDQREDISATELSAVVQSIIVKKGYTLFEDVSIAKSNFNTVGILFADIVGYLAARVDTIVNDAELFENLTADQLENNGKIRKLKASNDLLKNVRTLKKGQIVLKKKV
jgi:hypothetical protein